MQPFCSSKGTSCIHTSFTNHRAIIPLKCKKSDFIYTHTALIIESETWPKSSNLVSLSLTYVHSCKNFLSLDPFDHLPVLYGLLRIDSVNLHLFGNVIFRIPASGKRLSASEIE